MHQRIAADLSKIATLPDFSYRASEITDAWEADGIAAEAVSPILRFMEQHPDIDYGSPGPLTHFVERVRGPDYGQRLVESVARTPTMITLWMLHRLINGTDTPNERRPLIACLRQSRTKVRGNPELSQMVEDFLGHLARKCAGE